MDVTASSRGGRTRSFAIGSLAVAIRPWLWGAAVRLLLRSAPRQWWRRRPYLPIPSAAYLDFRYVTAYGHAGVPRVRDLVAYLEWCRHAG